MVPRGELPTLENQQFKTMPEIELPKMGTFGINPIITVFANNFQNE